MNEDYVNFEVAKLLKEKGFDWRCEKFYINTIKIPCSELKPFAECKNWNNTSDKVSAVPLWQAAKWLRGKV